jgi:ABC-type antimicrobial peptide transport system permease subunit
MTHLLNDQLFRERSLSSLAGFFSLLALVLACLGLYGTLSYGVVRRTPEIGVRMALGARRQDVLALVVRQGLKLVRIGLVIGLGAALALTRLVSACLRCRRRPDDLRRRFAAADSRLPDRVWPARPAGRGTIRWALRYE